MSILNLRHLLWNSITTSQQKIIRRCSATTHLCSNILDLLDKCFLEIEHSLTSSPIRGAWIVMLPLRIGLLHPMHSIELPWCWLATPVQYTNKVGYFYYSCSTADGAIFNFKALPISRAISLRAATKSSYCLWWPSSTWRQWAKERSCFGSCVAKARVLQARQAAWPVAPPTVVDGHSTSEDQYNSVWKKKPTLV